MSQYARITYVIQEGDDGCVKIGSTAGDLRQRVQQLQVGNPQELQVVGIFLKDIEAELHEVLDVYRLRGEWFGPPIDVLEFLRHEYGLEMRP